MLLVLKTNNSIIELFSQIIVYIANTNTIM
jgi:hypothetical protein